MNVFLDEKLIDTAFAGDATTFEEMLLYIQSNLCAPGQMVVSVCCDGREVALDSMADMLRRRADSFERLHVITGTKDELVLDAMSQASTCLAETDAACRQAAELLKRGNTVEATETLGECLRIWQKIHEAIAKSIEMLGLDPDQTTVNEEPFVDVVRRPKDALLHVRDALRSQDFVLLADILEYEFGDVTDSWHAIIGRLRQEAQDAEKSEVSRPA